MDLSGKIMNCIGDSITAGYAVENPDNRYCEIIKRKYGLKKANCYGINGTRIAKQKSMSENPEYDLHFVTRVPDMDPDADIITILGGVNDFGHGDAPLGKFSDRTSDTFFGALHVLYSTLIEKYPKSKIVVLTPIHFENEDCLRTDGETDIKYVSLRTYVEIIKEVAEYYALPVCDLYATSGIQPKVPIIKEMYIPDGLHPNDAGQELIADRIGAFLSSL